MYKHITLATVAVLCFGANLQAQLTSVQNPVYGLAPPTYTYVDPYLNFDDATGVLELNGSQFADKCTIYTSASGLDVKFVIDMNGSAIVRKISLGPKDVTKIVFKGGNGNDSFRFANTDLMAYYYETRGWFDISCELFGGPGTDIICGGIGDDVICGGFDGCEDILIGNLGADLFLQCTNADSPPGELQTEYELFYDVDDSEGDDVIFDYLYYSTVNLNFSFLF